MAQGQLEPCRNTWYSLTCGDEDSTQVLSKTTKTMLELLAVMVHKLAFVGCTPYIFHMHTQDSSVANAVSFFAFVISNNNSFSCYRTEEGQAKRRPVPHVLVPY